MPTRRVLPAPSRPAPDPLGRPADGVRAASPERDDAIVRHGVPGAGMAFLSKPFTPDALAAKVRELLDEPRRAAAGAPLTAVTGAARRASGRS